ncbi:hypothetical protein I350_07866 [Cryptococcus amylolentus CBS 6273]|uniref:BAH domain-containing protein n=1 Tax=Cryptococcus amylolentus CBS 6273 TaxID=1296118 RepID=A0A1E3JBG4_9TREE|nr:hypothetical protein I350_07866 [Cryptococcus amylolentus CBS 6273]
MPHHNPAASASDDEDWVPPTEEEYRDLKKYKSFIMPMDTPYSIGEFVWMHHDKCRPLSDSPPRPAPRRVRPSLTPSQSQREGSTASLAPSAATGEGSSGALVSAEEEERQRQRREVNKMWKAGHWIGRIIEVRARGNMYVWMKIRWMCRTISELKEQDVKTGLPRSKPAGREIFMLGPEYDAIQPVGTVEGRVPVVLFDESNPIPPEDQEIDEETIWYRHEARMPNEMEMELLHPRASAGGGRGGKGKRSEEVHISRHLFASHLSYPYQPTSCYCGDPYLPIATKPELMALCPNPGCLRWFHLGCLDWTGRGHDHRLPSLTPSSLAYIRKSGLALAKYMVDSTPAGSGLPVPPMSASTVSSSPSQINGSGHVNGQGQTQTQAPEIRTSQTALRRALTPAWSWANRHPQAEGLPADTLPSPTDSQALLEVGLKESLLLDSEARAKGRGRSVEGEGEGEGGKEEGVDMRLGEEVIAAAEGVIVRGKGYGTGGNARKILSARWIVHQAALSPPSPSPLPLVSGSGTSGGGQGEDRIVRLVREWETKWGGVEGLEVRRCVWSCPGCERLM